MRSRFGQICISLTSIAAYRQFVYRSPLIHSSDKREESDLLADDNDSIPKATLTPDDDIEFQFNEGYPKITGTFRSDTFAYLINEFRQKSIFQIMNDLYQQPTVIAELSFIASGAIFSGLGLYFGRKRLRNAWFNRNFYNTINISLNTLNVNTHRPISSNSKYLSSVNFNVRTVLHAEINELIPNPEGVKYLISNATNHVRAHKLSWLQRICGGRAEALALDPILKLESGAHFVCYRLLRNAVSELCAPWFIARDLNNSLHGDNKQSLIGHRYVIAICVEEEKWSKIHVVLTKKENLMWIIDNMNEMKQETYTQSGVIDCTLLLDEDGQKSEWKKIRWNTIIKIAEKYNEQLQIENNGREYTDFAELELIAPDFTLKQNVRNLGLKSISDD